MTEVSVGKRAYANDLSLIIERAIDLSKQQLELLEEQADEFRKKGEKQMPKGWAREFQDLTKSLSDLSMSHARYMKAQDEWLKRLSAEEKLEATKNALIALHNERPGLVRDWLDDFIGTIDDARYMHNRLAADKMNGFIGEDLPTYRADDSE